VKGTWREGSLAGDPEEYVEKVLETRLPWTLRDKMKGAPRSFFLRRNSVEGASGGGEFLHWGPWKIC